MLWHWALILSIFALISSAHQRLLRHLPSDKFQDDFDDAKIKLALNLFLSPPVQGKALDQTSPKQWRRRASRRMLWMWQCPTMLMNYSWVLFLVGYGLHVLKPVFDPDTAETSKTVRWRKSPPKEYDRVVADSEAGRCCNCKWMSFGGCEFHFLCCVVSVAPEEPAQKGFEVDTRALC